MADSTRQGESDLLARLVVDPSFGLSTEEAAARIRLVGPNALTTARREAAWQRMLRPLREPMALLLIGAGIVYFLLGERRDALIMFAALVPIAAVDYALEERAQRTLARLKGLVAPTAALLRNGLRIVSPVTDLVPGDVVFVQEGDVVAADGVLIEGSDVRVDEATLTGEAFPVAKEPALLEQVESRLRAGTTLVSGRGKMIVTETGLHTEYGRIGALVAGATPRLTPTQKAIEDLVRRLGFVAGVLLLVVVSIELLRGTSWGNAVSAGVSLAIAVIPEEYAVVFTLYLTLGAWRMARRNALLRRLTAVETLGSVSVICADKTGTLTEGRMTLTGSYSNGRVWSAGSSEATSETRRLLAVGVLASEPRPYDPLEQSLLAFARQVGLDVDALYGRWDLVQEYPFDPRRKYVSHIWRARDGTLRLCAKGAIEGIFELARMSDSERDAALQANRELATGGMRVLAVAERPLERFSGKRELDEEALEFVGLIGFTDPPRSYVRDSIADCRTAGIRVIMTTGDHPLTAQHTADAIGLPPSDLHFITGSEVDRLDDAELQRAASRAGIFARINPAQKHRLVRVLKECGEVVAMTGDGINDAPALREADVGVAMGLRGTAVAREAATMVLLDDNFRTIVAAVREGRRIFDNLRQVFHYLIAFHIPILVTAVFVPVVGAPLLLLPAHLVWLELIVHPTSSLVFEADPPAPDLMHRPPRPARAPFLRKIDLTRTLIEGFMMAGAALSLYLWTIGQGTAVGEARSLAITSMIAGQILVVLMERSPRRPFWEMDFGQNRFLVPLLSGTLASLLIFLYVPQLAETMRLEALSLPKLAFAIAVALAALLPVELTKCRRG